MNKITFIGAGSMAEAIIAGIVKNKLIKNENLYVTNRGNQQKLLELNERYSITGLLDKKEAIMMADVVVLAMKPADVTTALTEIREYLQPEQLIISVLAGTSSELIEEVIGKPIPVIRSMPNTSATIGHSATAISQGKYATDKHVKVATKLFQAVGTVSLVNEKDMHMVTALSGSGPAYFYYFVEAMEKAAELEGFDGTTAKELIIQTIIGAGNMLQTTGLSAKTLRENVTSPNGTTAAGLSALQKNEVDEAIIQCVNQAKKRSIELGEA